MSAQEQKPKKKRPRDLNKLAFMITEESTAKIELEQGCLKNQAAVELGRLGGFKRGKARAAKLTPEQRSEIARDAAKARWTKK
jgi:hypothetical protein